MFDREIPDVLKSVLRKKKKGFYCPFILGISVPLFWNTQIGKDAPAKQLGSPDGEIWIDFAPQAEWAYKSDRSLAGSLAGVSVWHPSGTNSHEIARAHVWVIPSTIRGRERTEYPLAISWAEQYTSYVAAHELLHALGLLCHVQSKRNFIGISS